MDTRGCGIAILTIRNNISANFTATYLEYNPTVINTLSAHKLWATGNAPGKIITACKTGSFVAADKKYVSRADYTVRTIITQWAVFDKACTRQALRPVSCGEEI